LITIEWRGINNIHYTLIGCGEKKFFFFLFIY